MTSKSKYQLNNSYGINSTKETHIKFVTFNKNLFLTT